MSGRGGERSGNTLGGGVMLHGVSEGSPTRRAFSAEGRMDVERTQVLIMGSGNSADIEGIAKRHCEMQKG